MGEVMGDGMAERSGTPTVYAYELGEPDGWTTDVARKFGQRLSHDASTVTLHRECPRCHHGMSVELDIQGRTGKAVKRMKVRLRGKDFVKVAFCNCARHHQGRPDNALAVEPMAPSTSTRRARPALADTSSG
jgi:hypothetical protein